MEMLDNMPTAAAASHTATKLPAAQANYNTLQQFLKQGHPYQPKDAPLARSEKIPAPPRGIAPPKQTSQPLPSSEPAKVKAVNQALPAAFLTPTSSATTSTTQTSTASPTPLRLTGSDANGVRIEVVIPVGAIDASQATTAGGKAPQGMLSIALTQRHGHYTGMTNEPSSFQWSSDYLVSTTLARTWFDNTLLPLLCTCHNYLYCNYPCLSITINELFHDGQW
jgi:hypothetical protein